MYEGLKQDYQYFSDNFKDLYKQYPGKYLVIKDCRVLNAYDDFDTAYKKTLETEELGTFIIQECKENDENQFMYHHNNVAFAAI